MRTDKMAITFEESLTRMLTQDAKKRAVNGTRRVVETATVRKGYGAKGAAIGIVRPLAEYNGAGLQASDWPITLQVINGRKALRCSWCDGVRKYPGAKGMAKPRNPIRECGQKGCGLLLCGHAAVYVEGKGTRCAKHAK